MTALFEMLVRSSLVLLIGLAALPLLRRRSAALRHWVLLATLVCAALAPLAARLVPRWRAPVSVESLLPARLARTAGPLALSEIPAAMSGSLPGRPAASPVVEWLTRHAPAVWGAGAGVSLAMLLLGLYRLRRLDAAATPLGSGAWAESLADMSSGASRQVAIKCSDSTGLLLVWGLRLPTIIVPASSLDWPRERMTSVLGHELAHVERRDWLLQIVTEVIRACYWFNPLVWVTCARLRAECEVACDDRVVASGTPAADYATHVVAIARALRIPPGLPAPTIARRSTLERRVKAMLDKTLDRRPVSARVRARVFALAASVTLAVAAVAAQSFVSLTGTIVDPSNGVLPGVTLNLTNAETQAKYQIRTDRTGRYEFVGLPPGTYTIEAALPGFARFAGQVSVATQNLQQDLTLIVGTIQETITVRQDATPAPPDPERQQTLEGIKQRRAQESVGGASRCSEPTADGVRMGGNIRVPLKLRDVRPLYPESLRGSEGVVVLSARIAASGSVDTVDMVSSTHPDFTQSAIDAVKQWEFDATLLNCTPIPTPMTVTVNYKTS